MMTEAITWSVDTSGHASDSLNTNGYMDHVRVFINNQVLPGQTGAQTQHVLMHELGHALGLAHSLNSADLMYKIDNSDIQVNTYDVGVAPPCSQTPANTSNEQAGIRCIYDWTG